MKRMFCAIITFFNTIPLFGMEMPSEKSILQTQDRIERLEVGHRSLQEGLKLYNQGNFPDARHLLLGGYYRIEKYDPQLLSVDPRSHDFVYNAIIKTQLDCKNLSNVHIDRAITFAHKTKAGGHSALTDTGIILTQKAAEAHEQKNYVLEDTCNKKAFSLFEQECHTNQTAKEYYNKALCYGIGCEYNSNKALPYFLMQLKQNSHYLLFTEKTLSDRDQNIKYISHFADNGDMRAQCVLVKTYINGEYNVPISHEKTLYFCEQFILKLATIPSLNQLPIEYFIIPLTLKQLSFTNKKAYALSTFYNFLYADKMNNEKKIKEIYAKLQNQSIVPFLKVIRSTDQTPRNTLAKIKGLTPHCKIIKVFCESEFFSLGLQLLQQKLESFAGQGNAETDALNWIIGLCEYYKKNYIVAHAHLTQCTGYKNDLYTQALILATSTVENRLVDIAESIIPLLKIAGQCPQPRPRDEKAKQIIADIFNSVHQHYIRELLRNQKYTQAYRFAYCLTQLEKTHKAACDALLKIEACVAQESEENYDKLTQIPARTSSYELLKKIAAQEGHDESVCDYLAYLSKEQAGHPLTDNATKIALQKECLSYLSCTLKHEGRSEKYKNDARPICGLIAHSLGITEESINYLDQAIAFGNEQALRTKATLLLQSPSSQDHLPITIDLLRRHACSNDSDHERIQSIKELANYYYTLSKLDDKKQSFYYLITAAEMNDHDLSPFLAHYYLEGIKAENGSWYLQPNVKKASDYLTKYIALEKNQFLDQALFMRALTYYNLGELEGAFADLETCSSDKLSYQQKTIALLYMGIIKILTCKTKGITTEIVDYFRATDKQLLEMPSSEAANFEVFYDQSALDAISEKINLIIFDNNTDIDSLDFCYLIGKFLCKHTEQDPITCTSRMLAIKSLKHAAEYNHPIAATLLYYVDNQEIIPLYKIYYLEKALLTHPDLTKNLQPMLDTLYPKNIASQAQLINFYTEQNNPELLKKYLSSMYEHNAPIAPGNIFYSDYFSYEEAEKLISICSKNELLVQSADAFVKNSKKSIPLEHFAAIFYGSLLSYSLDQAQLIKGANYLETARTHFPLQLKHIEINLGQIYYKLGWRYARTDFYKPILAILYLQKSIALRNIDAMVLLSTLWLDKVDGTKNIDKKTICEYLNNANVVENSKRTFELLQRYHLQNDVIENNSSKKEIVASQKLIDAKIKSAHAGMVVIDKQIKHSAYPLIINSTSSDEALNTEFQKAVDLMGTSEKNIANVAQAIIICQKLANQKPPHPHACMHLALYFAKNPSSYGLVKQYLQDAIISGIIKLPNIPNAQFKDAAIVNSLFQFIDSAIFGEKQTQRTTMLLKLIKENLTQQNVYIKAFEELFKFSYGKDLTKHRGWK
ncbi:MAG TPA: hypothetical protein VJJ26_03985 [Candidatus Babeliales bacterium]|nr:hypothetical protein [Candidatus Babeliales bacterium]